MPHREQNTLLPTFIPPRQGSLQQYAARVSDGFCLVFLVFPPPPNLLLLAHATEEEEKRDTPNRPTYGKRLVHEPFVPGCNLALSRQLLRGVAVKRASNGEELDLLNAWEPAPTKKTIVAFFTHTADFNSW